MRSEAIEKVGAELWIDAFLAEYAHRKESASQRITESDAKRCIEFADTALDAFYKRFPS